jgi:hypothetical protein
MVITRLITLGVWHGFGTRWASWKVNRTAASACKMLRSMLLSRGKNHKGNVRGGIFNKEWEIKTGIFRENSQNVTHIISSFLRNHLQRNHVW